MIIFESTLTTFEASFIFWRQLGQYQKLARAKNQTTIGRFSFAKSLKHTVGLLRLSWRYEEVDYLEVLLDSMMQFIEKVWYSVFFTNKY